MGRQKKAVVTACAMMTLFGLAGCGGTEVSQPRSNASLHTAKVSVTGLPRHFQGVQYDYEPFESPSALQNSSDLVVKAAPVKIIPGREEAFSAEVSTTYLALEVKIDEVYAGGEDVRVGDTLLVELPNAGDQEVSEYNELVSQNLDYVLYLDGAKSRPRVSDDNLETVDLPLFTPTNPQSVWIGDGNQVVQLLDEVVVPGEVEDAAPIEAEFPSQPQ